MIGFVTAGLTAFYMFRLVNMTFFGESHVSHEAEHHLHESPPLDDRAADDSGGAVGGRRVDWLAGSAGRQRSLRAFPGSGDRLDAAVAAARRRRRIGTEYGLMVASVLVALLGIWLAWQFYFKKPDVPEPLAAELRRRSTGCSTTSITWTRFTTPCSSIAPRTWLPRWARSIAAVINGLGVDGAGWLTRLISCISMVVG